MLINITTSKGNLTKVKINKPFEEITAVAIFNVLRKKGMQDAHIYSWAPTSIWHVSECYDGLEISVRFGVPSSKNGTVGSPSLHKIIIYQDEFLFDDCAEPEDRHPELIEQARELANTIAKALNKKSN